jgi:beta-glucosidase
VLVENTGGRTGAETVQIYLRHPNPSLDRPDRELVGFQKLEIKPGLTADYSIHIDPDRLAYYHDGHARWVIEPGDYELLVGASVTDIRFTLPLFVRNGTVPQVVYTMNNTLGEIHRDTQGSVVVDFLLTQSGQAPLSQAGENDFMATIMRDLPFKKLANFSGGALPRDVLHQMLEMVNSDMDPEQVRAALQRN